MSTSTTEDVPAGEPPAKKKTRRRNTPPSAEQTRPRRRTASAPTGAPDKVAGIAPVLDNAPSTAQDIDISGEQAAAGIGPTDVMTAGTVDPLPAAPADFVAPGAVDKLAAADEPFDAPADQAADTGDIADFSPAPVARSHRESRRPASNPERRATYSARVLAAANTRFEGDPGRAPISPKQLSKLLPLLFEPGQDRQRVRSTFGYLQRGMSERHAHRLINDFRNARDEMAA